jgi:hypothetical protein
MHDVSETGSVSVLRQKGIKGETPILLDPLARANINHWIDHTDSLSKGPNRIGFSPFIPFHLRMEIDPVSEMSCIQFNKTSGRWIKSRICIWYNLYYLRRLVGARNPQIGRIFLILCFPNGLLNIPAAFLCTVNRLPSTVRNYTHITTMQTEHSSCCTEHGFPSCGCFFHTLYEVQ